MVSTCLFPITSATVLLLLARSVLLFMAWLRPRWDPMELVRTNRDEKSSSLVLRHVFTLTVL